MFTDKRKENTILKLNLINNKLYDCVFINYISGFTRLVDFTGWNIEVVRLFSKQLDGRVWKIFRIDELHLMKAMEQKKTTILSQDLMHDRKPIFQFMNTISSFFKLWIVQPHLAPIKLRPKNSCLSIPIRVRRVCRIPYDRKVRLRGIQQYWYQVNYAVANSK